MLNLHIYGPQIYWSPMFLAPGTGFMEHSFSTGGEAGSGCNASSGELQMKHLLLPPCSSPAEPLIS